jgi:hypothetical protein
MEYLFCQPTFGSTVTVHSYEEATKFQILCSPQILKPTQHIQRLQALTYKMSEKRHLTSSILCSSVNKKYNEGSWSLPNFPLYVVHRVYK